MRAWHVTSRRTRNCSARSWHTPRTATSARPPRWPNRPSRRASSIRCCSMSLATRLEEEGKLEEAARLLERGVALAPADVPVRNALALVLQRLERPEEALAHVEVILAQHPQLAFAHASKGNALIAAGLAGPCAGEPPARPGTGSGQHCGHGLAGLDRHPPRRSCRRAALGGTPARPRAGIPGCRAQPCRRRPGRRRRPPAQRPPCASCSRTAAPGPRTAPGRWACWATCWMPRGATRRRSRPTAPATSSPGRLYRRFARAEPARPTPAR